MQSDTHHPSTTRSAQYARFLLCEKTGRWAQAVRRLAGSELAVVELRILATCQDELTESPGSILALELTDANGPGVAKFLLKAFDDFPRMQAMIFTDSSLAASELNFRNFGAIHFVTSVRQLQPALKLIVRHLGSAGFQRQEDSLDAIWNRLPWKNQQS